MPDSEKIQMRCPACQRRIKGSSALLLKTVNCPACKKEVKLEPANLEGAFVTPPPQPPVSQQTAPNLENAIPYTLAGDLIRASNYLTGLLWVLAVFPPIIAIIAEILVLFGSKNNDVTGVAFAAFIATIIISTIWYVLLNAIADFIKWATRTLAFIADKTTTK